MARYLRILAFVLLVVGCALHGTPELSGLSPKAQAVVIKQYGGVYKVGNPYQIMGKWYYPKEDYHYSEIGIASWYGDDFHAKRTANGEKYDMNTLTAAHRTLPLPSIVRVTNLENGRSLVLRVNDRGPYAKDRIIDISKRGAQLLGYQTKGTAKVKVEIMEDESKALKAALIGHSSSSEVKVTMKPTDVNHAQLHPTGAESLSSKFYFIQVGSFKQRELALQLEQKLKKFGTTQITEAYIGGSSYYRVQIGPISSEDVAQDKLLSVQSSGFHDARILKD